MLRTQVSPVLSGNGFHRRPFALHAEWNGARVIVAIAPGGIACVQRRANNG
ncbi:hypothetical protein RI056_14830 [Komagataeibacter nataicola]|uniref:hypothetical protein n=1 Tax=Komagataeibacter nataicola TaxID=265960 RepID=UPI0028B09264|nr:hypothetical protein [Komagataeibacter nataicola]WNM08158.1 hypothetical protein RI056_14830 [Komagataeibacter nataicola]